MRNVGAFLALGLASILAAERAQATSIDGRVRLGLEGTLASHDSFTLTAPGGADVSGSTTSLGLGTGGLGVGIGVGIGDSFLLGGRLLFSHESLDVDGGSSTTSDSYSVLAAPEWVLPGSDVRPFLGAVIGHRGTSSASSLTFLGPEVGLHWFAADSFSLDPSAGVYFETGVDSSGPVDVDRTGYVIMLSLGLSGWLGGATEAAPGSKDAAAEAASPPEAASDAEDSRGASRRREPAVPAPSAATSHAMVPLGNGDRATFEMDGPDAEQVAFHLVVHGDAGDSCSEITARTPGHDSPIGPFQATPAHENGRRMVVLSAVVPVEVVRSLARSEESVFLDGCAHVWEVPHAARRALRALVLRGTDEPPQPLTSRRSER